MPHQQSWLIQNRVVYVVFTGDMSAGDVGDAFHESARHVIESNDAPVHFFHNWTEVRKFPTSLSEVFKVSRDSKAPVRNVGWVVAFGQNTKLFKFMGNIFFQLFGVHFRLFETAEEAADFLCEQDTRLEKSLLLSDRVISGTENTV